MPKKYLLYIHDDRFRNEKKKSELVNALLDRHYAWSPLQGPIVMHETKKIVDAIAKVKDDAVFKPCKHGADPKFCRFAMPGKPCK